MQPLTRQKYLSADEVSALQAIFQKFKRSNPRDITLLRLAFETGARASEILLLTSQDIDRDNKAVFIKGLKNCKSRLFPLSDDLFASLSNLAVEREGAIFPITPTRFRQIWHLYRPCKKPAHALRHTRAVMAYKKTKNIKLVQRMLGHRQLATTDIYLDFEYSLEELRSIL